jgi:hypothetical protein
VDLILEISRLLPQNRRRDVANFWVPASAIVMICGTVEQDPVLAI